VEVVEQDSKRGVGGTEQPENGGQGIMLICGIGCKHGIEIITRINST
jgi:hypothetical protein